MNSMFYSDPDYSSSLLKSPKPTVKKDHYSTTNGKLHSSSRLARDVDSAARSTDFEMKSILKNNYNNYAESYCLPTTVRYRYSQPEDKVC